MVPMEGHSYLFRWSSRKRKVSRLASGRDSSRLSMQLSFATGSERAAEGGGVLLLRIRTAGWRLLRVVRGGASGAYDGRYWIVQGHPTVLGSRHSAG